MKRIMIASLCLIFSVLCYGKMGNRILHRSYIDHHIYEDSAKVAIKIKVDSAGRAIAVTYDSGLSFNESESMIRIAKRKALQMQYPQQYYSKETIIIFRFTIAP